MHEFLARDQHTTREVVDFIEAFEPICYKIASASLTDDDLLRHTRATGRPIILSTGMSTMEQIRHAVGLLDLDQLVLVHSTCTVTIPVRLPSSSPRKRLLIRLYSRGSLP